MAQTVHLNHCMTDQNYQLARDEKNNKSFDKALIFIQKANESAQGLNRNHDFYLIQLLHAEILYALDMKVEASPLIEVCLNSNFVDIQKKVKDLILSSDQTSQTHSPILKKRFKISDLAQISFKYSLGPQETIFIQLLSENNNLTEANLVSQKIFGTDLLDKSHFNRLHNLITRVRRKTGLQIQNRKGLLKLIF